MTIEDRKKKIRAEAVERRAQAHRKWGSGAGTALASHELPIEARSGQEVVSGFYPVDSEIDVRPLLGRLAGDGWVPSLPVVIAKHQPLEFRRWYPGEPTVMGRWEIPRPADSAALVEPDVLLVPMLAFDKAGYRLGYGGGFYDRTLALLRSRKKVLAVGAAYAAQEIDAVPRDGHDQPLDFIMTEEGWFRCG
jgi:5-formyltetrahydrofolate cyclo-ligase